MPDDYTRTRSAAVEEVKQMELLRGGRFRHLKTSNNAPNDLQKTAGIWHARDVTDSGFTVNGYFPAYKRTSSGGGVTVSYVVTPRQNAFTYRFAYSDIEKIEIRTQWGWLGGCIFMWSPATFNDLVITTPKVTLVTSAATDDLGRMCINMTPFWPLVLFLENRAQDRNIYPLEYLRTTPRIRDEAK